MVVFCYKMKLFLLEIMKILAIFYNKGEKLGGKDIYVYNRVPLL